MPIFVAPPRSAGSSVKRSPPSRAMTRSMRARFSGVMSTGDPSDSGGVPGTADVLPVLGEVLDVAELARLRDVERPRRRSRLPDGDLVQVTGPRARGRQADDVALAVRRGSRRQVLLCLHLELHDRVQLLQVRVHAADPVALARGPGCVGPRVGAVVAMLSPHPSPPASPAVTAIHAGESLTTAARSFGASAKAQGPRLLSERPARCPYDARAAPTSASTPIMRKSRNR